MGIPLTYWSTGRIARVILFKPSVITIKPGTNDARRQYRNKAQYMADYKAMIDTLSMLSPKPRIWLLLPCPSWRRNGQWPFGGISDDLIKNKVMPVIRQAATEKGLAADIIDLHTPMIPREALVPDGVHPEAVGLDSIARWVYRAMRTATASRPAAAPQDPRGGQANARE